MNSLNTPLWWAVVLLALIYFHTDDGKQLETAMIYPVSCRLAGNQGHRQCAYKFFSPIIIRANLTTNEVVVFETGDLQGGYVYSGCTILDAENFSCRWLLWPGQDDRSKTHRSVTGGKYFPSDQNDEIATCYPNQIVRWAIWLGVFPANYDASATVRDWLNCAEWYKF